LPHVRTLIKTERLTRHSKSGKTTSEVVYHTATENPEDHTPAAWGMIVRNHWGIENRNHWRRDACLLEDKTRSRNPNIVAAFALLRGPLLLFNARTPTQNLNAFIERTAASRSTAFAYVMSHKGGK
jgi:predicted transposase YbfD/YdcC